MQLHFLLTGTMISSGQIDRDWDELANEIGITNNDFHRVIEADKVSRCVKDQVENWVRERS